jgi:IS30 family transposase
MEYQHFSIEERERIQEGLWHKESIRDVAASMGRSPSSVSREIRKNLPPVLRTYAPRLAHARALEHRTHRGRILRLKNETIRTYIVDHLKKRWSPEQIAGRIKSDIGETISHEAIYQYVYAQISKGTGLPKTGCLDLRLYLRRRKKGRSLKGMRRREKLIIPARFVIDARPVEVGARVRIGDWEGDTVESISHKPGVNTLVERKTGFVFITKLKGKTSADTLTAVSRRFENLPPSLKRTLTLDRGAENRRFKEMEAETGVRCFLAHAYSSWERGTNENTNGLIRDYFPKKTDFTIIREEEIAHVERELNTRPRKRLGRRTPQEAMSVALQG